MTSNRTLAWMTAALVGCASADPVDSGADDDTQAVEDGCQASVIADDFGIEPSLGEMGDPANWGALPPDAVVATTYLRINFENFDLFEQANGPIIAELMSPDNGLMGVSTGFSETCGVARTLTVWASEEAMMDFVFSDAHGAAMAQVEDISRGGSITDQTTIAEMGEVSWTAAADLLSRHSGPVY